MSHRPRPKPYRTLETDGAQSGDGDHPGDHRGEQIPPPGGNAECDQSGANLSATGALPIRDSDACARKRRDDRDRERAEITPAPGGSGATKRYGERQRSHEIGCDPRGDNRRPEHHSRLARSANATKGARAPATTTATADAPA